MFLRSFFGAVTWFDLPPDCLFLMISNIFSFAFISSTTFNTIITCSLSYVNLVLVIRVIKKTLRNNGTKLLIRYYVHELFRIR